MRRFDKCTISFNEDIKGWVNFWSFKPDWMVGMNNIFYTFKDGDLYESFNPEAKRNTFYGITYPSKVTAMVNAEPSTIKEVQSLSIEGNVPWNIESKAFETDSEEFIKSTINSNEFVNKEGFWYAYARRNEDVDTADAKAVYGIGTISAVSGDRVVINGFSDIMTVGDVLYDTSLNSIGVIKEITRTLYDTSLILELISTPVIGMYVMGGKDPRIEGGNLRGYVIKVDMEIQSTTKVELYALNVEVIKSFPS